MQTQTLSPSSSFIEGTIHDTATVPPTNGVANSDVGSSASNNANSNTVSSTSTKPVNAVLAAPDFDVYVIESSETLEDLKNKLSEAGHIINVSVMKRWDVDKKKLEETKNKNRVMCKKEVMQGFLMRYSDYKPYVEDYKWATFPYPKQDKGETTSLHVTCIPNDYTQQEASQIIADHLASIGLTGLAYTMKFQLKSRETGTINGFCRLVFDESVNIKWIYLAKLLLHHMPIKAKYSNQISNIVAIWYIEGKKARNGSGISNSNSSSSAMLSDMVGFRPSMLPRGISMVSSASAISDRNDSGMSHGGMNGNGMNGNGMNNGMSNSRFGQHMSRGHNVMTVPRRQLPTDMQLPGNITATSRPIMYSTSLNGGSNDDHMTGMSMGSARRDFWM